MSVWSCWLVSACLFLFVVFVFWCCYRYKLLFVWMFLFAVFNMLSIYMFLFLFCVVKAFSCFRFACFSLSVWCCWLFPRQDHPKFNTFPPRLSRINGISQFLSNFEFLHRVRIVSDVFKSTLVWFPSKFLNSAFVSSRKARDFDILHFGQ